MRWISLLYKDFREHALSLISLALGFLLVLLLTFRQQSAGTFSMSTFEVVRFSLGTIIPLIAFIVGNRLIVREFTGGTRQFVEALPVSNYSPLLIKYLIGLVYILGLCAAVVFTAAAMASAAEDVNQQYLTLLLLKTGAIGSLIWSLVFFISFTGKIRLVIYVVLGLALMHFYGKASFDQSGFPPFALLDRDLFVFERDIFPWKDLIITGIIALLIVLAGFFLALVNEGSIAEKLGKPITQRDIAAFALLGVGCLTVYATLQKDTNREAYVLSGETVLRDEASGVAVSFLDEANRPVAERVLSSLAGPLTHFQTSIGLDQLPQVQIALNTELEPTEIEPSLVDGVFIQANYIDYDTFEMSLLTAVAMHHMLLTLTTNRWDYETRHWLLDGLARWWNEGGETAAASVNNDELFALAWITQQRMDAETNPLLDWQSVTDQHGFEGADALSYVAILYLESITSSETVVQLSADYINEEVGSSSLESMKRLMSRDDLRFSRITGIDFQEFTEGFLAWLDEQALQSSVAEFIAAAPNITGEIVSVFDADGSHRLEASYEFLDGSGGNDGAGSSDGTCVLRHQPTFAFDQETMIYTIERDRVPCTTQGVAHSVDAFYARGDRVYGLLEYETEKFHRPIPIWVGRIHVK